MEIDYVNWLGWTALLAAIILGGGHRPLVAR
jgi:hypothetical protein